MFKRIRNKSLLGNRGMTLVEILLVMAIMSVVMLAVISLYIPAHRSTVTQSQVSDIQSGLRLALKVMSRDLLHAGFLAPDNPITNYNAAIDNTSFTIQTRIVGNNFGRVADLPAPSIQPSGKLRLTLADSEMVDNFPNGSLVRLFEPINSDEVKEAAESASDSDRAYPVDTDGSAPAAAIELDISQNSTLLATEVLPETVVVRVNADTSPPMQTILYQLNNDSLERVINGVTQVLARNVDTDVANSNFRFEETAEGRAHIVHIKLTAKTVPLATNDAVAGEKVRSVSTSVKLRNVF